MKKVNLLLLGMGGNVTQGIFKAIQLSKIPHTTVGACVSADSAGLYMCDKSYLSPYANDPSFVPWLIELCQKEKIDFILTGVEEIIRKLAKNIDQIKLKTNANFVCSSYEQLVIGQDKLLTCQWLENNNCNFPRYSTDFESAKKLLAQKVPFPFIAKPRRGKGSSGIVILTNEQDFLHMSEISDYVIQECIGTPDQEYTVGCYCDKTGILQEIVIMHRTLVNGTTKKAVVVKNPAIQKEAIKICNAFKPIGPMNIQLRLDNDSRPVCFELNVRFSGTTPIRAHLGYNDVEAMINEYVYQKSISGALSARDGTVFRYDNELYVLDDSAEKLNSEKYLSDIKTRLIYTDNTGVLR